MQRSRVGIAEEYQTRIQVEYITIAFPVHSTVEMLSSLLFSSSSRAELFRIVLGSGRAFMFEPRVGSDNKLRARVGFCELYVLAL